MPARLDPDDPVRPEIGDEEVIAVPGDGVGTNESGLVSRLSSEPAPEAALADVATGLNHAVEDHLRALRRPGRPARLAPSFTSSRDTGQGRQERRHDDCRRCSAPARAGPAPPHLMDPRRLGAVTMGNHPSKPRLNVSWSPLFSFSAPPSTDSTVL